MHNVRNKRETLRGCRGGRGARKLVNVALVMTSIYYCTLIRKPTLET
jgi:hypothetical protein